MFGRGVGGRRSGGQRVARRGRQRAVRSAVDLRLGVEVEPADFTLESLKFKAGGSQVPELG